MKTIILCGGLGYRLKEETEFRPKPMVHIGNKPMLWHIMKIYSHFGYNEFIIALGYKGDYIKDYFLNQKYFLNDFTLHTKTGKVKIHKSGKTEILQDNFVMTFVDTGQETLPGERILLCKNYIPGNDTDFMVTYGDGVANIDIKKLYAFHKRQGTIGTITGVFPHSKYGQVTVSDHNIVDNFNEKPKLKDFANGGFMVFKKQFFEYLMPGELEHEALKRLVKIRQLSIFPLHTFWHSMDTYTDVQSLNHLWETNPEWRVWKE